MVAYHAAVQHASVATVSFGPRQYRLHRKEILSETSAVIACLRLAPRCDGLSSLGTLYSPLRSGTPASAKVAIPV